MTSAYVIPKSEEWSNGKWSWNEWTMRKMERKIKGKMVYVEWRGSAPTMWSVVYPDVVWYPEGSRPHWLNSSSLSWDSFLLSLTSTAIAKHARPFIALLDSGSSHCFVDELFAMWNKFSLTNLPHPILLQLFDGSSPCSVNKKTIILVTFSTGETHEITCYVTKLDKNYTTVLGYDWLTQHNPRINWVETKVMFVLPTLEPPITQNSFLQKPTIWPAAAPPKIDIWLISGHNLARMSWKKGSTTYITQTDISSDPTLTARSNTLHPDRKSVV